MSGPAETVYPPSHPFGYRHECGDIAFWLAKRPAPRALFTGDDILIFTGERFQKPWPRSIVVCAACGKAVGLWPQSSRVVDLREIACPA